MKEAVCLAGRLVDLLAVNWVGPRVVPSAVLWDGNLVGPLAEH